MKRREGEPPKSPLEQNQEAYTRLLGAFVSQELHDIIWDYKKRNGFLLWAHDRNKVINIQHLRTHPVYSFISAELTRQSVLPSPLSQQPSWHINVIVKTPSHQVPGAPIIDHELSLVSELVELYASRKLGLKTITIRLSPEDGDNNHTFYRIYMVMTTL